MKKFIAILLICVFILSMAACGKKANNTPDTQPQSNGSSQAGSTAPTDGSGSDDTSNSGENSAESTAPAEDPTTSTQDPNKVEPTPEPNKGTTDKDADIKVEIDNSSNNAPVVTPPDDNKNNSFVIDFDDLLEASKK